MQDLVLVNGKLNKYNFMRHEIIGNKTIMRYIGGEMYAVAMPVARVRTSGELKGLILCGFIGAIMLWASLVLIIGLAPVHP